MDYDDNDFQGQNIQLAGERDIKYSSIIRPYALPKFDLDESLQEHLRFESLVGTEVFLSIDSQENNNWIGDFSRCSSGISFCPGGADSCSISRQNHAWSEAASPESVEMLLKSVGQEEMNQGQTLNDPHNELIDLPKGVGPSFSQGNVILYKVGDSVDSHPTVQSDHFGCLSELSGATAVEAFQSEGIEQINKCESYVFRSFNSCSYNSHKDKCFLLDPDGCYLDCNDLKDGELVFHPGDTPVNEVQDLSSSMLRNNSLTVDVSASRSAFLNDVTNSRKLGIQEVSSFEITEDVNVLGAQVCDVGDLDIPSVKINGEKLIVGANESSESFDFQDHSNLKGNVLEIGSKESPTVMVDTDWELNREISERSASFRKDGEWKSNIYDDEAVVCSHEIRNEGTTASSGVEIVNFNDCPAISAKGDEDLIQRNLTECNEKFVSSSGESFSETDYTKDCDIGAVNKGVGEHCLSSTLPPGFTKAPHKFEEFKNIHGASCDDKISDKDLDDITKILDRNTVPDTTASSPENNNPIEEDHDVLLPVIDEKLEPSSVEKDSNKSEGFNNSTTDDLMVQESGTTSTCSEHITSQNPKDTEVTHINMVADNEIVSDKQISLSTLVENPDESHFIFAGSESGQNIIVTTTEIVTINTTDESMAVSKNCDLAICSQPLLIGNEYVQKSSEGCDASCIAYSTMSNEDCINNLDAQVNENIEESNAKSLSEEDLHGASGNSEDKIELERADFISPIVICEVADIGAADNNEAKSTSSDGQCLDMSSLIKDEDMDNAYQIARPSGVCEEDSKPSFCGNGKEFSDPDKSNCGSPSIITCSENIAKVKRMQANINEIVNQNVPFGESNEAFQEETCSILPDAKAVDSSIDDKSFTFEVTPLADVSGKEITTVWQPFSVQAEKTSEVVEGSNPHHLNLKEIEDSSDWTSLNSTQHTSCDDVRRGIKSKGDIASPVSVRESSKKACLVKESEKEDKSCESSPLVVFIGQSEGFSCISRPSVSPSAIASNLPDLNTSAFPSIVFQQPFTDLQQVQLRAQILVYGSLMQGTIPDEAWMSSAFGVSDGGRKFWEKIWHVSIERFHDQKSQSPNSETPMQSNLGTPPTDPAGKHSSIQSKIACSPACRSNSKAIPSSGKSMTPLSPPLWSVCARLDGLQSNISRGMAVDFPPVPSPSRPYRSPPIRNFIPHPSWTSPSVFQVPWITSQHTPLPDSSTFLSTLPTPEIVRLSPAKELSLPNQHSLKLVSPCSATVGITESVLVGSVVPIDTKRGFWTPNRPSIESKSRKKKKIPISEENSLVYPTETESVNIRSVNMLPSTSYVHTSPISTSDKAITAVSPPLITSTVKAKEPEIDQGVTLSEESLNKVKEAKQQAEEAAAHADAAVCHTQYIWSQLDKKKNSGLLSNVEAELAGAAVTIAAAASIAKAAAAAAKIASNAAFHAKLMVDEAFLSSGSGNNGQSSSFSDSMSCMGKVSASSVIVAAKEAAQRKIEAASAASKRAENLDAVIKAAELAAEAISQAGKIVTMGDPLPLADLVKAGPDGFWKLPIVSSELSIPHRDLLAGENAGDCQHVVSSSPCKLSENDTQLQYIENIQCSGETSGDTEDHTSLVDANSVSAEVCDENLGGKKDNELNKLSEITFDHVRDSRVSKSEIIKEGAIVEVFKDDEGYKAAWFLANVVGLVDGNALVCYNEITAIEGSGQHKEWVALVSECDKAPRIRVARPRITVQPDGTRKRSRATMSDIVWTVGDRVDAWIKDSWWEGEIKEKRDELTFYVNFPAHEETSVVGVWLLRPSLIWNNAEWVEQSIARDNSHLEGDVPPQEKRMKLCRQPSIEPPTVDTLSKNVNIVDAGNHGESSLVNLSSFDKVFSVGKNYRDVRSRNTHKIMLTASQREESKVMFGVPKTGKKRKLMEVGKNHAANQCTKNIPNDSAKLARFFSTPVDGSLNSLRRDLKEKHSSEARTKVLRSVKTQIDNGTLNDNNLPTSGLSTSQRGIAIDNFENFKNFSSAEENTTARHSLSKFRAFSGGSSKGPVLFSSSSHKSESVSARKVSEHGNVNKSKVPPVKKLAKIDEEKVLTSDVEKLVSELTEPRRSNRRIQPTSRMLEGLQSSLNMPKLAPVSHDRAHRNGGGRSTSSSRNIPRGGGR